LTLILNKEIEIKKEEFSTLEEIVNTGPRDFWKKPTGIKI